MNRISKIFEEKKVLIAFVTAGDPDLDTTERLIAAMAEAGVDMVQIGVPFSDPVAGGAEIQQSDARALAGGCTVDKIFDMVARVREKVEIPLIVKSYMNPIFVYGKARFMGKCSQVGIDGVIVPDLPYEERDELAANCAMYGIARIPVIAHAAMDRIQTVAQDAEGFIVVPALDNALIKLMKAVSPLPCVVAIDVPTPQQAEEVAALADGLVIESAIIRLVAQHGNNSAGHVRGYIEEISNALI